MSCASVSCWKLLGLKGLNNGLFIFDFARRPPRFFTDCEYPLLGNHVSITDDFGNPGKCPCSDANRDWSQWWAKMLSTTLL